MQLNRRISFEVIGGQFVQAVTSGGIEKYQVYRFVVAVELHLNTYYKE